MSTLFCDVVLDAQTWPLWTYDLNLGCSCLYSQQVWTPVLPTVCSTLPSNSSCIGQSCLSPLTYLYSPQLTSTLSVSSRFFRTNQIQSTSASSPHPYSWPSVGNLSYMFLVSIFCIMVQKMLLRRKPGRCGSPWVAASSQGFHSYVSYPGPINSSLTHLPRFCSSFWSIKMQIHSYEEKSSIGCN